MTLLWNPYVVTIQMKCYQYLVFQSIPSLNESWKRQRERQNERHVENTERRQGCLSLEGEKVALAQAHWGDLQKVSPLSRASVACQGCSLCPASWHCQRAGDWAGWRGPSGISPGDARRAHTHQQVWICTIITNRRLLPPPLPSSCLAFARIWLSLQPLTFPSCKEKRWLAGRDADGCLFICLFVFPLFLKTVAHLLGAFRPVVLPCF